MFTYLRIAAIVAGLVAVAGTLYFVYDAGRDGERASIEKENTDAAGKANEASMSLRDCRERGGVYVFETGKCRWTETGNR